METSLKNDLPKFSAQKIWVAQNLGGQPPLPPPPPGPYAYGCNDEKLSREKLFNFTSDIPWFDYKQIGV